MIPLFQDTPYLNGRIYIVDVIVNTLDQASVINDLNRFILGFQYISFLQDKISCIILNLDYKLCGPNLYF